MRCIQYLHRLDGTTRKALFADWVNWQEEVKAFAQDGTCVEVPFVPASPELPPEELANLAWLKTAKNYVDNGIQDAKDAAKQYADTHFINLTQYAELVRHIKALEVAANTKWPASFIPEEWENAP